MIFSNFCLISECHWAVSSVVLHLNSFFQIQHTFHTKSLDFNFFFSVSDSSQEDGDQLETISMNDINEVGAVDEVERSDELMELVNNASASSAETRNRRRRFNSQPTFPEDPLDNDENNR